MVQFPSAKTSHDETDETDETIDATLSLLAHAQPAGGDDGLHQRVHARLTTHLSEHLAKHGPIIDHPSWYRSLLPTLMPRSQGAQRLAASLLAATAIIAGALAYNSHRAITTPMQPMRAVPHVMSGGMGTAGAVRIAPQPVKPALRSHGRGAGTAIANHGRASIGSHHKPLPAGVAVPNKPTPEAAPADTQP